MAEYLDFRECSVARTIEVLGDKWVFLILREAFFGAHYYDQFQERLGIATNILSDRLKSLVENGIMDRLADRNDKRRVWYKLTEKGLELYEVTLAFMKWGDKWLAGPDGPPLTLRHKSCGKPLKPTMCCGSCGKPIDPRDVGF